MIEAKKGKYRGKKRTKAQLSHPATSKNSNEQKPKTIKKIKKNKGKRKKQVKP